LQAIRWIGSDKISGAKLSANPHIHPVRIDKDALGPERPSRDIMVSSQHRIVIHDDAAGKMYGSPEILVPAIALLANEQLQRRMSNAQHIFTCYSITMKSYLPMVSKPKAFILIIRS